MFHRFQLAKNQALLYIAEVIDPKLNQQNRMIGLTAMLRQVAAGDDDLRATPTGVDAEYDALATELNKVLDQLAAQKKEALQHQKKMYESILDQSPWEFVLFDDQMRFLFINAVSIRDREMREWLIGKTDSDYFKRKGLPPERGRGRREMLEESLRDGEEKRLMEVIVDAKGTAHHLLRIIHPILDQEGKTQMIAGYSIEVTELVEKEAHLQKQNEELEKINHELDQFVYRASHDLRAPLLSLLGLINLLELEEQSPAHNGVLEMMRKSILRMDTFIKDIVNHSKNSRQELTIEPVDLLHEAKEIIQQLRFMAHAQRIDFRVEMDIQAPFFGDRFRIGILLNNLLSNAIKYHDPKKESPYACIRAKVTKEWAELSVQDNGMGISALHRDHVFEMFYRAVSTGQGSGIGLYIVQEVAHRMGGKATIESEEGVGTTVTIRFPNHPTAAQ